MCLFAVLCVIGCANILPPSGGTKDTSPPELIGAIPENKCKNFNSNTVVLFFDEYIDLEDVGNITLSPNCGSNPQISVKSKKIEIRFNCKLDSSTTYTLNFGKSIVDINERNPVSNFKYIFSTGPKLDSLFVEGVVSELYFDEKTAGALVCLATSDSMKPYYYTFTNEQGYYLIENIQSRNYWLFALSDKNNNLSYEFGELVSRPKKINKLNKTENIGLFYEQTNNIEHVENIYKNVLYFKHNRPIELINVLNADGIWDWNKSKTESFFWFDTKSDYIYYTYQDFLDSIPTYSQAEVPKTKLYLDSKIHEINSSSKIRIKCNNPVDDIISKKFILKSATSQLLSPKLISPFCIEIPVKFSVQENYQILVDSGAIISTFGTNDSFVLEIDANQSNYGSLNMFSNNKSNNIIAELYNDDFNIRKIPLHDTTKVNWIKPGDYNLRLFIDTNNNGFWDAGVVNDRITTEKIQVYPKTVQIRSNWELDLTIPDLE